MRRRQVLFGLGSLTSFSAFTLGTGAFGSTQATRTVAAEVARDSRAYLRVEPSITDEFSRVNGSGSRVEFYLPGLKEQANNPDLGLGADSIYSFPNILEIDSQLPEEMRVYGNYEGDVYKDVGLVYNGRELTETNPSPPITRAGDPLSVGIYVGTMQSTTEEQSSSFTIVAEKIE